jgi:hypothetical protein
MIARAMPSLNVAHAVDMLPTLPKRRSRAKGARIGKPQTNPNSLANLVKWQPGTVINPGGRTDDYLACQRICREASPTAARKLVELINDPDPRIALMAADKIVDRAWGRPRDYDPKRDAEHPRPTFDPRAYSTAELLQLEVALKLLMENRTVVEDVSALSK